MKPFLLLSTRPEDAAAEGERRSVLRFGGLADTELVQIRAEQRPLPSIDLDDWSGVLLGGGPFNSSDPEKSQLQLRVEADLRRVLDGVLTRDYPFLGLCYGVGTVTSLLGGVVDRTYGEAVGEIVVTLTDSGRRDPLLAEVPAAFRAFVGHKEAVRVLPETAVLLATGERCPVQMFRVGANGYVTQFHPELDGEGLAERIMIYREAGYFPPSEAENLAATALSADLDEAVHSIVRRFVEHYRDDEGRP